MSGRARLTFTAAGAVTLGCAAVVPLYADLAWLGRALGAVLTVALTGLAARRLRVPALLQPPLTTGALGLYLCLVFAHRTLAYGVLPTGATRTALDALLQTGFRDIDRLAPPVPTHPGLTLIAVAGVGAVAVVVDLVAVALGRTAPAGLALLVLYAVPSAVLPGGLGWLPFSLTAVGWLWLLRAEGRDRLSRWGAPMTADDRDEVPAGRVGRRIGAAALGVAVVLPAFVPGMNTRLVGGGSGSGGDGPARTTTTYNPITRLRADLHLPAPREVLRYTTDADRPDYLRMTTLDLFTATGWSSSRLTGDTKHDGVKKALPLPLRLQTGDATIAHTTVRLRGLDAQWLPAPAVPTRVKVDGPWLYDARSETLFGIRTATRRLKKSYTVTSLRVPSSAVAPAGQATGVPGALLPYIQDPGTAVTTTVRTLTAQILGDAATPYDKVLAIQHYFTDPAQGFRYSLSSKVPGIDSANDLEAFLRGHAGFCEQYASAMAAMVRLAGVPARVAVGFTPGARQRDGSFRVTTSDAHAWPEAWFDGAGWVRFEPTPRADQVTVPSYAQAGSVAPGGSVGPLGPSAAPSLGPAPSATTAASRGRAEQDGGAGATAGSGQTQRGRTTTGLAVAALLGIVLLLPRGLHLARRRRRWRSPGPLVAWAQLRDDAVDLGHRWRPADTPRVAAAGLAEAFALDAPAQAALDRVTAAVEQARYARDGGDPVGLAADTATVRSGLRGSVRRTVRWRAWLLPVSTLRWASAAVGTAVANALDRLDGAWGAVLRRLRPAG